MVMLARDWGRGRVEREEGARGLRGDETKLGELKEREGVRSGAEGMRRRGASKVGVVGVVRGDCWNWSSTRECRSRSSFVGDDGDIGTGEEPSLPLSKGCQSAVILREDYVAPWLHSLGVWSVGMGPKCDTVVTRP
jgi:hypothetical protein